MFHGGKIAMLGIMPGSAAIDWNLVVFNGLTHQRNLRPRDVRNLVQDDCANSERPRYFTCHHAPLSLPRQFKEAIELMKSGNSGKIVLDWVT